MGGDLNVGATCPGQSRSSRSRAASHARLLMDLREQAAERPCRRCRASGVHLKQRGSDSRYHCRRPACSPWHSGSGRRQCRGGRWLRNRVWGHDDRGGCALCGFDRLWVQDNGGVPSPARSATLLHQRRRGSLPHPARAEVTPRLGLVEVAVAGVTGEWATRALDERTYREGPRRGRTDESGSTSEYGSPFV